MLIASAVWLMHKTSDLYSEVRMLGKRVTEAAELLSAIQLPEDRESTLEAANRSGNRLEREGN